MEQDERKLFDLYMRREIANHLYRIFCLESPHVAFSYDEYGLTIRIPWLKPVSYGGPTVIYGITKGLREYHEEAPKWGFEEGAAERQP